MQADGKSGFTSVEAPPEGAIGDMTDGDRHYARTAVLRDQFATQAFETTHIPFDERKYLDDPTDLEYVIESWPPVCTTGQSAAHLCDCQSCDSFHTEPGDTRLTVHPKIHEDLYTVAGYLGYTCIRDIRRCLVSPRVVKVTRLLYPLLADPSDHEDLETVFAWFVSAATDTQFRAESSGTAQQLLICLHQVGISGTKGDVPDPRATAIAYLLVWALGVLSSDESNSMSKPASRSNPAALLGAGLLDEDSYLFDCILNAIYASVYRANKKRASREQTLEEAQAIAMRFIPKFDEHEFEKYARIIALVRHCAQTIFTIADHSKILDEYPPENGDMMYADGETVADREKREHFRDTYAFGPRDPIELTNKPIWMQTINIEFLLVPTMGACVQGRVDLLRQCANPVEPVEGCSFEHSRIIGKIRGPVDFGKIRKLPEWIDELCVSLRFTDPASPRHITSVGYCDGIFQGTSFEELAKVKDRWRPVYSRRLQDIPISHQPWDAMKGYWSDMDVPRTVVVAHCPLPPQETESYPFWTGSYQFMQAHHLSTQGPNSTLTPVSPVVFPVDDGTDAESASAESATEESVTEESATVESASADD
ncbi:hypothetical protein PG993_006966 [Apiospora rasikravindrae]|uniref:Aminotransferase-like plant mobile domain-containing protein n=1 Tax=Apiospora rasikravindrae TaxID=990691 RepID=A0ABR1SXY1_9PEZI